jgi:hypothetical protein
MRKSGKAESRQNGRKKNHIDRKENSDQPVKMGGEK